MPRGNYRNEVAHEVWEVYKQKKAITGGIDSLTRAQTGNCAKVSLNDAINCTRAASVGEIFHRRINRESFQQDEHTCNGSG
jgi:hypothetical protein